MHLWEAFLSLPVSLRYSTKPLKIDSQAFESTYHLPCRHSLRRQSHPDYHHLTGQMSKIEPSVATPVSLQSLFPQYPHVTEKVISSMVSLSAGDARMHKQVLAPAETHESALLNSTKRSVATSYDRTGDVRYDLISALQKAYEVARVAPLYTGWHVWLKRTSTQCTLRAPREIENGGRAWAGRQFSSWAEKSYRRNASMVTWYYYRNGMGYYNLHTVSSCISICDL